MYYAFIVNLARRMGMKTYILANGVGVIISERNKKLTAKTVSRADVVTLRDEESKEELASIGVDTKPIRCTADPAVMLGRSSSASIGAALTISSSTAPWVSGHSPISRAGKTLVSLTTKRSLGVMYSTMSAT